MADLEQPPWKKIKLSLEQPYKNENGDYIPQLLDITPEGEQIYQQREEPALRLGDNLMRIISDRGLDFFSHYTPDGDWEKQEPTSPHSDRASDTDNDDADKGIAGDKSKKPMSSAELFQMRSEILPQLYVALGEMTHAQDLLFLLTSTDQPSGLPSGSVTATNVIRPDAIPSVQAFNAQLIVGGKDSALRKAAHILKEAAESAEHALTRDETYWIGALTARQGNWGMFPAPLPPGVVLGKGADRSARDFAISFGMEEAPAVLKRRALSYLSVEKESPTPLVFQQRQETRLRISIVTSDAMGNKMISYNSTQRDQDSSINSLLHRAQLEIVEQEIFGELIKEAGALPTAETRVSERLISIEAAINVELIFELVPSDSEPPNSALDDAGTALCDLIHACLYLLLLRAHYAAKALRLAPSALRPPITGPRAIITAPGHLILQPVIDFIQYRSFCERVSAELLTVQTALLEAGVRAKIRFIRVGEGGEELISLLDDVQGKGRVGGEAILRVDERQTVRLTFQSPSMLTAQVAHANVAISSLPQLSQLLNEEVELCLLERICDLGKETCGDPKGLWFVDRLAVRTVGRWEGHVASFMVTLLGGRELAAEATLIGRGSTKAVVSSYPTGDPDMHLFAWVNAIVATVSASV